MVCILQASRVLTQASESPLRQGSNRNLSHPSSSLHWEIPRGVLLRQIAKSQIWIEGVSYSVILLSMKKIPLIFFFMHCMYSVVN